MNPFTANWRFLSVLFLASCFLAGSTQFANAQQEPFSFIQPPFTQELYATAPLPAGEIDGGIAFAPNGDLWVDSCNRNKLFRFSASETVIINGSTVHAQVPGSPIPSNAGCGLTNHPDGTLYSNSGPGLVNLDASTGAQLRPVFGPPGNGFGIAVDPQTNNLVYVGGAGACGGLPPCVIFSVNPVTQAVSTFAQISSADATFIDGIFFDPTGNFLFLAVRTPDRGLTVLDRNGAVVQHVHMATFPDGVAFHSSPDFVATVFVATSPRWARMAAFSLRRTALGSLTAPFHPITAWSASAPALCRLRALCPLLDRSSSAISMRLPDSR
jgi:hypothetical protein